MTVEQHDVIDIVAMEPGGSVLLVISDHLPWDEVNQHLWQLQEKLNRYVAFVESKELYEKFPDAVGRPIVIRIVLTDAVPEAAQWFFGKVRASVQEAGFGFEIEHRPLPLH